MPKSVALDRPIESTLYKRVQRWAKASAGCYHVGVDTGLRAARIDIVGVRDTGGNLHGAFELVAIEVKAGRQPFATTAGQAHAYSVYADRCYLADWRPGGHPFTPDETEIATHLGIGLLAIGPTRIVEVSAAPKQIPIERLRLELLWRLGYAPCAICGSAFDLGKVGSTFTRVSRSSSRGAVLKAVHEGKGFVYWLDEPAGRQQAVDQEMIFHRRHVCPDCVDSLFGEFVEPEL